jgi:signal transduction histidine kinase
MEAAPRKSDSTATSAAAARNDIATIGLLGWLANHTDLEGKLILSFMGMLAISLGVSCHQFFSESRNALDAIADEHGTELSRTLAIASASDIRQHDVADLNRLGYQMLKERDVVGVAFYDAAGAPLAVISADHDADDLPILLPPPTHGAGILGAWHDSLPSLGRFVMVTAPLFATEGAPDHSQAVGYASVCLALSPSDAILDGARSNMVLLSTLAVLACAPIASMLVHAACDPVRRLVAATQRIIAGDLQTQVAIDRRDVSGVLARSFNKMVQQVRQQREALAAANRELESKVAHRTAQLETANNRLRSAIAEKEDFLRTVSHDLNAPLRNIAGMAALLMRNRAQLDDEMIHRLERIQKNVEVETDLIGELMELSRIKTQRLGMETVEVRHLVEETAGLFEADLRTRNIRLLIEEPMPALNCERTRLRQVFQNLIDNAIKYMGERPGVPREIRVGSIVRPDEVEFFVRDSGIGIAPEDLDRIFHVFRRGTNVGGAGVPGKGVGLASVRSIIETYSGSIWVESQPGVGSTFRFTINGKYVLGASQLNAAA